MIEQYQWLYQNLAPDKAPGSNRSMLAGCELRPEQLLPLPDLDVRSMRVRAQHQGEPMVWRSLILTHPRQGDLLWVTVMVAQARCLHARHALVASYLPTSEKPDLVKGDDENVDVGDLCFLPARAGEAACMDFVRRNVAVKLYSKVCSQAAVYHLAVRMDDALDSAPPWDPADDTPLPAAGVLSASRTKVPQGGRVELKVPKAPASVFQEVVLEHGADGSINRTPSGGLYYRAGSRKGAQLILMHRVNARNLLRTTSLVVEVV